MNVNVSHRRLPSAPNARRTEARCSDDLEASTAVVYVNKEEAIFKDKDYSFTEHLPVFKAAIWLHKVPKIAVTNQHDEKLVPPQ